MKNNRVLQFVLFYSQWEKIEGERVIMGKLTVVREKNILDFKSKFQIILDNEIIGYIENGKAEIFDVTKGEHIIRIRDNNSDKTNNENEIKFYIDEQNALIKIRKNPLNWICFIPIIFIAICFLIGIPIGKLAPLTTAILIIVTIIRKKGGLEPIIEQLK